MPTIMCSSPEQLAFVAQQLIDTYPQQRIFTFDAPMGAGKTTFIKEICNYLGVTDNVASPTFSIVNEYVTTKGENVYHFDLYRLKKWEEMLDIGYEMYFDSGNYCFIEWPEKIQNLLPDNYVNVSIQVDDENVKRTISF